METILDFDRDEYISQLQTIHAMRDALGLDMTTYRDLLYRISGSSSAKYMTAEQRQRVMTVMQVHQALDSAAEYLEEARDILNRSYDKEGLPLMQKRIMLDGQPEISMNASLEEVIETMRSIHGDDVRLVGIKERRLQDKTLLELAFERPQHQLNAA